MRIPATPPAIPIPACADVERPCHDVEDFVERLLPVGVEGPGNDVEDFVVTLLFVGEGLVDARLFDVVLPTYVTGVDENSHAGTSLDARGN